MENQINEQLNEERRQMKKERKRKIIKNTLILMFFMYIIMAIFAVTYVPKKRFLDTHYVLPGDEYSSRFPYHDHIEEVDIINNGKANTVVGNLNIYIPQGFVYSKRDSRTGCSKFINRMDYSKLNANFNICEKNELFITINDGYSTLEITDEVKNAFKENNLNNTLDVLRYTIKTKDFEPDFKSENKVIALNYYVKMHSSDVIESYDNFYFLNNDLNGFYYDYKEREKIYIDEDINIAYILIDDSFYEISFKNNEIEYFNNDNIFEILSSISKYEGDIQ